MVSSWSVSPCDIKKENDMAISIKDIQDKKGVLHGKRNDKATTGSFKKMLSYEIGGGKLSDGFRESFYGELALLLEAGMNIKNGLDLLAQQQKKEKHKALFQVIIHQLTQGARFSEVLRDQKKFSAYEHFSIRIGEETGNLIEILQRLSTFYTQKIQQRRSIIGALTYPMIILATAFLAVTFMFTYMVPLFKDVFLRMGGDLPWLTKMIIQFSEKFSSFVAILFIIFIPAIILHFIYKEQVGYQRFRTNLLIKLPIFGSMLVQTYTLRMVQSMSLLITSKVPITEALELSQRMVKFYPISHSLEAVRIKILQGKSLNEGMAMHSIYDQRLIALIKVGEETNQLGLIFKKLSGQMEDELSHKAKMLGNTMEPLIIVFLGIMVAIILIAMYMPMFQLSTSVG